MGGVRTSHPYQSVSLTKIPEILSPDGQFVAKIELGAVNCSRGTTDYETPDHPTTVSISRHDSPNDLIIRWHNDSESTGVQFSADSQFVEILWELSGRFRDGFKGRRYWRAVYHLPSALEITHDRSDRGRDRNTSHSLSAAGGTVSNEVKRALERLVRDDIRCHGEAIGLLQMLVDCGVAVSTSHGLLRLLFRILLRDISEWSKDEVALRLLVVRLLQRVEILNARWFLTDLLPRGVLQEPNRQEHNRLLDDFISRLVEACPEGKGGVIETILKKAMVVFLKRP